MKRFLAFLALLPLLAMGGGQYTIPWYTGANATTASVGENITYVAGSYQVTAPGTAPGATLTVTCAGGEFIPISLQWYRSGYSGLSITATNGNTVVSDYVVYSPFLAANAHIANCIAGSTTITVAVSGSYGYGALQLARYTGLVSQSLDAATAITTGSGTTFSCSITPTSAKELLIVNAYAISNTWTGSGLTAGFTHRSGANFYAWDDDISGPSGTTTISETTITTDWQCNAVAYK